MRRVLTVWLLVVAACVGTPGATTTTETALAISGSMTLEESRNPENATCEGNDGYDDLTGGANVVVKDGDGTIIGSGSLTTGAPVEHTAGDLSIWYCEFAFDVPLAREADFYTIEIAGRGGPVYSQAEMETMNWVVDLSIG